MINPEELLKYGEFLTDDNFFSFQSIRIRIIKYKGYIYYHKMIDGRLSEFKMLG